MYLMLNFLEVSSRLGLRRDLIQAAGGNTSIKIKGKMYVKPTGVSLYEMNSLGDVATVDVVKTIEEMNRLKQIQSKSVRDKEAKISLAGLSPDPLPSMETFMHAILSESVLHFHDNRILGLSNSKIFDNYLRKKFNVIKLGYIEPGLELALELKSTLDNLKSIPSIIILENHGIIITEKKLENCLLILDYIDNYFKSLDYSYKIAILFKTKIFVRRVQGLNTNSLTDYKPLTPDMAIYIGPNIPTISNFEDIKRFNSETRINNVFFFNDSFYILAKSYKRACETEDLLSEYILLNKNLNKISDSDIYSILNLPLEGNRK